MNNELKSYLKQRRKEHFLDSLVDNLKTFALLLAAPAFISLGIILSQ